MSLIRGITNFKKYANLGVLACNLHKLGNILLQKERKITKNKSLKKPLSAHSSTLEKHSVEVRL